MLTSEQQSLRLSLALKGAKSGLWDWDIKENRIYFDANFFLMAGYEPDEFPHHYDEWKKRVHPEDIASAEKSIQQYLAGESESYAVEFRFKTKNDDWIWILGQGEIVERDEGGHPVRFIGLHTDISQHKQAEETLQESEARFRQVYEHMAVGVARVSMNFRIKGANDAYCHMLGYREEELIGKQLKDITHLETMEENLRKQSQLASGKVDHYRMEKRFIHKSGRVVHGILDANLIRNAEGKPSYFLGSVVDITERKQAEQALKESEQKYRTLLDNQKEAVFLHKLQPEGFSCFSEVNASAVERYGYSRSEFLQIGPAEIAVPEDVKKYGGSTERRKLLEQGQRVFEVTHIKKSGELFPVEVSATLVELQGEKYILSTVRDITERKKTEELQRIKSIQQQALAELGQEALHGIDLSTLFAETTLKLAAVLHVDYTKILQKLPDQDELLLIAGVGWQEGLVGRACVSVDVNSLAGYTLTTEHPIVVEDLRTETRFSGPQLLLDHHVVSGLSVIIGPGKDPWGLLGVHSGRSREFTDDDVNFVQSVANLLAEIINRKQAEETLREERDFSRSLIDTAQTIVLVLDVEGRILRFNPYMEEISGYKLAEVKGKDWFSTFLPVEDHATTRKLFRKAVGDIQIRGQINPILTKDGSKRQIDWYNKTLKDAYGNVVGVLSVGQDVTERKQAEAELQESEERFRGLIESSSDLIWEVDTKGVYTYASPMVEEILGYRPEEIIGKTPFEMMPAEEVEQIKGIFKDLVERCEPIVTVENVCLHKDGRRVVLETSGVPILDVAGNVCGYRGVDRDVTERKLVEARRQELESQLRQKYKMEAVGLMAGGIAHDFNNNLAIILGNVELSLRKISAQNEIAPHLINAKIAILRARDLVQQILTYSRQGAQNFQPVKLPLVIDETLLLLRSTIPTTVEIETDIAHSHITINADSTQIQEVLINLCNNAVHAMEGQGALKIKLESLNVEQTEIPVQYGVAPGLFAKLSVQDTGSGITPEVMEKIFDPFFTTKEISEGTGMGLAVVHGIIKSHSGFARVNSHPGQGSTFEIYFPVIEAPKPGIIPTIHDLPKGNERILFVDDEEMLTNIWSQMLSDHGYQVTTKTSSTKALEMFKKNPQQFDLVITDQTMPELSGKDLIKELLSIRPDLPTVLCTGYSNKINEEEAEKLGIKAFCMKPLDMVELVQITRKVLDGAKQ